MLDVIAPLVVSNTTKIVLVSLDGLGGLPRPETNRSELETARLPNLSQLATEAACGLIRHVAPGITPGSGPGHLGLFGYDPLEFQVGRGVLEALGIEFDLRAGDVAARGNFCTVDAAGRITDRRAGRIPTEVSVRLTERLRRIRLPGVEMFVEPGKDYRFVLVLRARGALGSARGALGSERTRSGGLSARLSETDPQIVGKPPLAVKALEPRAKATAALVNRFITEAKRLLADSAPANMVLLRGFDQLPKLPRFPEVFGLRSAAIAAYPMYRGLAKLVGMEILKTGSTFDDELATLREHWATHDFFFLHYKDTDKAGEDGDFDAKVQALERLDRAIPDIRALGPDVLIVTGDHATPSILAGHGWQPVPVLVWSRYCGADGVTAFTERACASGSLGVIPSQHLMPLVMANALRLTKFGA
jgi:2,3-bisphosphoglycerate-independent phosphoglycerate mutase